MRAFAAVVIMLGIAFLALTLIEGRDNDYGNVGRRLMLAVLIVGLALVGLWCVSKGAGL